MQDHKSNPTMILLSTTLAALLTSFSASSVNVALPAIGGQLGLTAVQLSWVPTIFLLASAVMLIPAGRAADIFGRKKIFTIGIFLFASASLFSALATSFQLLMIARIFQGIGGAMVTGTAGAILVSVYPPGERGRVIGINTASVYVGLSAGPFLGGFLTQVFGWQSIFYTSFVLAVINLPVIFLFMRDEWADAKGEIFDWKGSLLYGFSLSLLIAGFSLIPAISGYLMTGFGLTGLILFLMMEYKIEFPVLNMKLFLSSKVFAFSNIAAMINYSASFSVSFFLSLFLQTVQGFSPQITGFILVTQPVVQALFSPLMGRLSDKVEPRILTSAGMAMTAAALLSLSFFNAQTSFWIIILCQFVLGAGFALFASPNTNAVMSSVDRKFLGTASSILGTSRLIGQMLSMSIAALLVALYVGHVKISADTSMPFLSAMKTGFILFTVLCLTGIYFSLARGDMRKKSAE